MGQHGRGKESCERVTYTGDTGAQSGPGCRPVSIMPEYSFSSSYSSSQGYSTSSSYSSTYSSTGGRWVPAALGGSYTVEVRILRNVNVSQYLSLNKTFIGNGRVWLMNRDSVTPGLLANRLINSTLTLFGKHIPSFLSRVQNPKKWQYFSHKMSEKFHLS